MNGLKQVGAELVLKGKDAFVNGAKEASRAIEGVGQATVDAAKKSGGMSEVSARMQAVGDKISSIGSTMTKAITLPIVAFGTAAIISASNLDESMNKVDVVFQESAGIIKDFATTAATNLGMSEQAALDAAGTFGNLFTSMGIGRDTSADMSTGLLQLAADLASFNNIDPTVALEKLRSGLVGETEPLRSLGINLTAVAVEAKAMAMGLASTKDEITPAIAAQARYALILEQTKNAQGDFARTSDGLANQMRIVKAQLANTAAGFGKILLPYVQKAITWINNLLASFQNISPSGQKIIVIILAVVAAIGPLLMIVGTLVSTIGTILPVLATVTGVLTGPVLLAIGAVIAVIALLVAAWKNNWGGIQEKTAAVWEWLKGVFSKIVEWFKTYIPAAITVLKNWWENTLLPAFKTVWTFVQTYIIPILKTLAEIIKVTVSLAIQVLAGTWNNILMPALKAVWVFIDKNVIPVLKSLRDFVVNEIGPKLLWFKTNIIDPLATTIKNALVKALEWVNAQLQKLKDWLSKIKLPDWLIGNSPTPFELGLVGIHQALQAANREISDMAKGLLGLPSPSIGVGVKRTVTEQTRRGTGSSRRAANEDQHRTDIIDALTRPIYAPALMSPRGGNTYNVPINVSATINNSQDLHQLAYIIAREFNQRINR